MSGFDEVPVVREKGDEVTIIFPTQEEAIQRAVEDCASCELGGVVTIHDGKCLMRYDLPCSCRPRSMYVPPSRAAS